MQFSTCQQIVVLGKAFTQQMLLLITIYICLAFQQVQLQK